MEPANKKMRIEETDSIDFTPTVENKLFITTEEELVTVLLKELNDMRNQLSNTLVTLDRIIDKNEKIIKEHV